MNDKLSSLDNQIFTVSLEKIFSVFGLVLCKLHPKLRNEKADKLTFMFKFRLNVIETE